MSKILTASLNQDVDTWVTMPLVIYLSSSECHPLVITFLCNTKAYFVPARILFSNYELKKMRESKEQIFPW